MLPLDLFGKSLSPPFITLPEENSTVFSSGALTPQKRTTTEPHASVPLAKRLQLSSESDASDLFPEDPENSSNMNAVLGNSISPLKFVSGPNSFDSSNVAGTPAFITTLMMKFIKFSDEQRQADGEQAINWQPPDSPTNANILKSFSNNNGLHSIPPNTIFEDVTANSRSVGNPAQGLPPASKTRADLSDSEDEDLEMKDDDECFLNNLPTSVDDLQDMEQQIKLERQMNSPLTSHRQSPFDAGRLSAISGGSYAMDGVYSSASVHHDEELDADDMEVAMINESFEEQQRQYKLYCGDELKSVFYSAPTDYSNLSSGERSQLPSYPMPVPVPDSPFNEPVYRWRDDSLTQIQSFALSPDVMSNMACAEEVSKLLPPLYSTTSSMESFKNFDDTSMLVYDSSSNMLAKEEDDAIATVLSSANFVLESVDSPHKNLNESDDEDLPLMMVAPKFKPTDHFESEDEELAKAWGHADNQEANEESIRAYEYWSQTPPIVVDQVVQPPRNIKALNHVAEIFETCGELDSEPMLQYFQSIGIKNFYQRDIDVQRAFLVFSNAEDAKHAVKHNNTKLHIRLLEESPQFIKMKAIHMYLELLPCTFDVETTHQSRAESWEKLQFSKPIAGV